MRVGVVDVLGEADLDAVHRGVGLDAEQFELAADIRDKLRGIE